MSLLAVKVCGFTNTHQDLAVIPPTPSTFAVTVHLDVKSPRPSDHHHHRRRRRRQKSIFGSLSDELAQRILAHLDLQSCLRLMKTNAATREKMVAWSPLQLLIRRATQAVQALMRTGAAATLSVAALDGLLRTRECELCRAFGSLLFLPTLQRCCFECLASGNNRLGVERIERVSAVTGIAADFLESQLTAVTIRPAAASGHPEIPSVNAVRVVSTTQAVRLMQSLGYAAEAAAINSLGKTNTLTPHCALNHQNHSSPATSASASASFLRERRYGRKALLQHVQRCPRAAVLLHAALKNTHVVLPRPKWPLYMSIEHRWVGCLETMFDEDAYQGETAERRIETADEIQDNTNNNISYDDDAMSVFSDESVQSCGIRIGKDILVDDDSAANDGFDDLSSVGDDSDVFSLDGFNNDSFTGF
ncbi:hypothetical protein ESCO_001576 [Escovopsis weberi]|uniref:F-box domain-containing protein n=1 Tax=Escovopsis weberi TaxID=150374 RepID=A0A0M8N3B7_ESCWE|nr:hypothetical protein ESCO_001576 [Escovopsis weberi]